MATINGVASNTSGTRNTYTISTGIPGDWTIVGAGDSLNFIGASTGVSSVTLHFKTPTGGQVLRYTNGPTVVNRALIVVGILITSASTVESGKTIPVSVNSSTYATGTWSIQSGVSTYVDTSNDNAPLVTVTGNSATFQGQSFGNVTIRFTTTSTPFGDEGYGTRTISVTAMPIQVDGFPIVTTNPAATNLDSGDTNRFFIDPSYDPFYANNVNGPNTQGVWSFESGTISTFESPTSGVSEVYIKGRTTTLNTNFFVRYTGSNGSVGRRFFNVILIPITGATTTFSGDTYTYSVDPVKYATGGTWIYDTPANLNMEILSQTSSSATVKAKGLIGTGAGSGFMRYIAGNEGTGRLFVSVIGIPLTGLTTVNTGFPYDYEAVGYVGGTWSTTAPNVTLTNTNNNIVTATFTSVANNQFLSYHATNDGYGRISVNSAFAIYGPNQIDIGVTPGNQITINIPLESVAKNGSWSTTTPSIISVVEGDQMNSATLRTATVTGLLPGTGVVRYFNNNGSTMYTYNITVTATAPVANNDSLTFNTGIGGSLNLVTNDALNGRTLESTAITDYSTVNPSLVSLNSSGLFAALPGIPAGNYVLQYTITTDYGTSNPGNINLTVTAIPPVTNDDTLTINNLDGGTQNLVSNDNLNGRSLISTMITDYSTLNSSYVTLDNTGLFSVAVGTPVGVYTLKYTITTDNGTSNESEINLTVINTNIPPVTTNDTLSVNVADGGNINVTNNDNLNGRPLLTATITDYSTLNSSYVTLDNTGLFTVISGSPVGNYTLKYTISTDNGTSNESEINLTIESTPPSAVDDSITINNITGGTANLVSNDNLNGRTLLSAAITDYDTLTSNEVSISNSGILTVVIGTPIGNYLLQYTITTDNGTSSPGFVNLNINDIVEPPIAADYLDIGSINSTQTVTINVLDDSDLNDGTVSSIDLISLTRTTPSISPQTLDPLDWVTLNLDGTFESIVNLEPGDYTVEYTITTQNGTSNIGTITFSVTSMPSVSGKFTDNSLDITEFSIENTQDLIFVRDDTRTIANLNSVLFDTYITSLGLPPNDAQIRRELLEDFSARPLEMLRRAGKDVFEGESLIKKRRIELVEQPGSSQTTTLKVSYDTEDLSN